jgi:glycosyltransferase involved in cell wall biosynthesis
MIRKMTRSGLIINGRLLNRRVSGVERYATEIIRRLPGHPRLETPLNARQGMQGHLWEQLILPFHSRGQLLWSPANSGPLAVTNQVVTICDTSVIDHPEWYSPRFAAWYRFLLPRLARRARHIFTPSEFSRIGLILTFSLPPDKVTVIYPGVDPTRFHPLADPAIRDYKHQLCLPDRYLLFVGTLEPRKNLARLIQAFNSVRSQLQDTELVIAGTTAEPVFAAESLSEAAKGLHFIGYVPEGKLAGLYASAQAFILPSLSEGFGLPVLESMACGTPVLATSAGALPELAAGAALLFDPLNVKAMAKAITQMLSDPALRSEYRLHGLRRARQFSWDAAALSAWAALEKLLSHQAPLPVDSPSPLGSV